MIPKLVQELGRVVAPTAVLAAKVFGGGGWYETARGLDPNNVAALQGVIASRGNGSEVSACLELAIRLIAATRDGADEVIKRNFSSSNSQLLQDIFVLLALSEKREGYFVEIGAADGIHNSNTLLLEQDYGWSGILAEPNPASHAPLERNRKSTIDHRAVYSVSGQRVQFFAATSDHEHSGLTSAAGALQSRVGDVIEVETITFDELLACHASPDLIDYVSIDTEGTELDILDGFDFKRRRVNVFTIEHNMVRGKKEAIVEKLAPHGYQPVLSGVSGFDVWLKHEDVRSPYL